MSVFTIQAPDGRTLDIEAADETTAVKGAQDWVSKNPKAAAAAPAAKPRTLADDVSGFMANVNRGTVVGDEMAAGLKTAGNVLTGHVPIQNVLSDFNTSMASQRQTEDSYAQAHPHLAALARGGGMAATMAVPGSNALAGGSLAGNIARGATTAGLTAAGYAAADRGTPQERLKAASSAAMNPVVLGLGAAGGALATPRAQTVAKPPVPTVEDLQGAKTAAYRSADNSGVQYTPEAFGGLVSDIKKDLANSRFDPDFHTATDKMVTKLTNKVDAGYSPTLSELDDLRKFVRENLASSPVPVERMYGTKMIGQIDDFIDKAGPQDVVSGSAENAANLIKNARDLNTRFRKVETLQDAVTAAHDTAGGAGSGGNINNAIRQKIKGVMNSGANFTPEETDAMRKVVRGGFAQNTLRLLGKLSPQGNGLMLGAHVLAAFPTGGASGVVAMGGAASKFAADRMTQGAVDALIEKIANGTPNDLRAAEQQLSAIASNDPVITGLQRAVQAKLSRAAGVLGAGAMRPAYTNANSSSPNALATYPQ